MESEPIRHLRVETLIAPVANVYDGDGVAGFQDLSAYAARLHLTLLRHMAEYFTKSFEAGVRRGY
jgi:hypothetical protein